MTAISFTVRPSGCTCPGCGKTTLLACEVLAIRETGLCFDCAPERGLVDELTDRLTMPAPTTPEPSLEQLTEWEAMGGCEATDGCWVEVDCESCPHGYPSWLVYLGFI